MSQKVLNSCWQEKKKKKEESDDISASGLETAKVGFQAQHYLKQNKSSLLSSW